MAKHTEVGKAGEIVSRKYLEDQSWKIIDTNVKVPGGEIDIITKQGKVLVFVEVKTMLGQSQGFKPEDLYRFHKKRITHRSCQWYAAQNPKLISRQGWRIDLVAISITNIPLTDYKKDCIINHYKNV